MTFPNVTTYLDKTSEEEQNDMNFKISNIGVKFNFIYQVNDSQTTQKTTNKHHA